MWKVSILTRLTRNLKSKRWDKNIDITHSHHYAVNTFGKVLLKCYNSRRKYINQTTNFKYTWNYEIRIEIIFRKPLFCVNPHQRREGEALMLGRHQCERNTWTGCLHTRLTKAGIQPATQVHTLSFLIRKLTCNPSI